MATALEENNLQFVDQSFGEENDSQTRAKVDGMIHGRKVHISEGASADNDYLLWYFRDSKAMFAVAEQHRPVSCL